MRILHVLGKLDRGGVETWLVQTLRHIDRSKYQFDFLVHSAEPGAYDEEVKALGARVLPCLSPSNPARFGWNFFRILREYGPYDCVHSHVHHYSGFVLTLARLLGVRSRIAHSHSDTRTVEQGRGIRRELYLQTSTRLLQANATAGFAVSQRAANALFPPNWEANPKWRILPLGIDFEPFSRPVDRSQTRKRLGIPEDAFVLGHVGRFSPVKNHSFMVDIAQHVCSSRADAIFLLVGDGALRQEIERRVRASGLERNFIFAGLRDDVPDLMQAAMDIFLFPSFFEGFPVALLEAQAAGLPCVVADTITQEVDILPQLVRRLSLNEGPKPWADAVFERESCSSRYTSLETMHDFSIDAAVTRLCSVYDGN